MLYRKPKDLRFTQLCIYIDENVPKIITPGKYPEIEATIYNYLWLLVKALAIKKHMFNKFEDYDGYAFYAATRLFLALRKNLVNQGKTIKGKEIRPIKSCLNYTKTLLYPMKIEYQRETFKEIIEEEFVSKKFDAFAYKEQLKHSIQDSSEVNHQFSFYLKESFGKNNKILDELLKKSPFHSSTLEYKNLKISVLLNSLHILETKNKLIVSDGQSIVLWHLPKNMTSYVKILLKEFFTAIKLEIMGCYKEVNLGEVALNNILNSNLEDNYLED